jgi:hypothetical protein
MRFKEFTMFLLTSTQMPIMAQPVPLVAYAYAGPATYNYRDYKTGENLSYSNKLEQWFVENYSIIVEPEVYLNMSIGGKSIYYLFQFVIYAILVFLVLTILVLILAIIGSILGIIK